MDSTAAIRRADGVDTVGLVSDDPTTDPTPVSGDEPTIPLPRIVVHDGPAEVAAISRPDVPAAAPSDADPTIENQATDETDRLPRITAELPAAARPTADTTSALPTVHEVRYVDAASASRRPERKRSSPVALRVLSALALMGALAFGGALMMSDRAPGVLVRLFGDRAQSLWSRIDARVDIAGDTPPPDALVHIAMWAGIVFLAAIAAWGWWRLIFIAAVAAVGGIAVEIAQDRWTSTRSMEVNDVLADLIGIGVGAIAAALVITVWRTASWLGRRA